MQGTIKSFRTDTQNSRIVEYLQTGKSLTCLQAIHLGLTHNLRSRVNDIRKAGYNIKSEKVTVIGTYIAKYTLIKGAV